jgi:hypothetical protein
MHLQGMWHNFMAQAGNAPGAQQGDVVVTLLQPVGGVSEVTVPSNDVTIAAEAGNLIGVQLLLDDGRRLYVNGSNLAGIIDAPLEGDVEREEGRPATGGYRPEEGPSGPVPGRPDALYDREAREADEADLEARVPAGNRTDEQQQRAEQRERDASRAQQERAREDDKRQREAEREQEKDEQEHDRGEASERPMGRGPASQPAEPATGPVDAATDRADAAHDRADAAQDREASARDKAAARRKPGR